MYSWLMSMEMEGCLLHSTGFNNFCFLFLIILVEPVIICWAVFSAFHVKWKMGNLSTKNEFSSQKLSNHYPLMDECTHSFLAELVYFKSLYFQKQIYEDFIYKWANFSKSREGVVTCRHFFCVRFFRFLICRFLNNANQTKKE